MQDESETLVPDQCNKADCRWDRAVKPSLRVGES